MERKVGVCGAKSCNEMVFERADGTLSSIATVNSRGGKLKVDVLGVKELFEGRGSFIVEPLEARLQTSSNEFGIGGFVGLEDGSTGFGFHWFCMDVVGIVAVQNEELCVALAGWKDEAASLVGKDLACRFHDRGKAMVGGETRGGSEWEEILFVFKILQGLRRWVIRDGGFGSCCQLLDLRRVWLAFCRTQILADLIQVAFGGGNRIGRVFG
jgi:hypothetical protein